MTIALYTYPSDTLYGVGNAMDVMITNIDADTFMSIPEAWWINVSIE